MPDNPLQSLLGELKISGQLPGEGIAIAITNTVATYRETMSQENRDKWDALQIRMAEDIYGGWRNLWKKAGVIE